ncbi:hypothetical protein [uncultured Pontibacter sp.]|uniref:hypothetical protein n=1 Tax=uncultured Pontibacter sp. TaxID=453356 RepID=UPI00262E0851|nr:hypothetical protein [uncultured Pontibacter sp.]
MDLDKLKTAWQQETPDQIVTKEKLTEMTDVNKHPVLRRIKAKLVIEAVAITVMLLVFYDIFDGHLKPVYATIVLVLGALFYLSSNLYSYFTLKHPVSSGNVLSSLQYFLIQLQRARAFSLTSVVLFSTALWVFFTSSISLDAKHVFFLAGMGLITLIFLYLSSRTWSHWISRIKQAINIVEE